MKRFLLFLLLAVPCFALTTVTDTLYRADGTTCSGSMSISWQTFVAPDGRTVYAGVNPNVTVASGVFSVTLEPGQYAVVYNITPGCAPAYENWLVPTSGGG
jgi:trimeric autotransporter adhesin